MLTTEAEEVAIALAIKEGWTRNAPLTIITDSQNACRNYLKGKIGAHALRILLGTGWDPNVKYVQTVTWAPGHEGVTGNLYADEAARGFTHHQATPYSAIEDPTPLDPCYATILKYYRENRQIYPPPHGKLSAAEATVLRRLQTNTYINLHTLHLIYPTAYRDICPWCGATPTLFHITWECVEHGEEHDTSGTWEEWEALLSSPALKDQLRLIQRAERMARASGALE